MPLQRGLEALATKDLEGQQRAKFSLTGTATGVLTSNLAALWFLKERF